MSAWPSPVVPLGQTVSLCCLSHSPLKRFILFKTDGRRLLPEFQGYYFNNFTLGPVTREHAGSFTCSGAYWLFLKFFPVLCTPYCGAFCPGGGRAPHCSVSLVAHFRLVLYLGLELLCALRSRSSPFRSVQETLSLSPGGGPGEVRKERDLGLQLRERL